MMISTKQSRPRVDSYERGDASLARIGGGSSSVPATPTTSMRLSATSYRGSVRAVVGRPESVICQH